MGMWMINRVKEEIGKEYSFDEIVALAEKENITSIVDAQNQRFMAPSSMVKEIQSACLETSQEVPITIGQIAKVIYASLADCYAKTALEIEEITGKTYDAIHIIGGGSKASYLNELTAKASKKDIYVGPIEATAIGNISAQMLSSKEFETLQEARKCIFDSFDIQKIEGEKEKC